MLDGRKVILIDTPGFESTRSDMEIFGSISEWLGGRYHAQGQPLDGLILLHPVTEQQVDSAIKKRTQVIQNILGKDFYKHVVIATTMWGRIADEYLDAVENDMDFQWGEKGVWEELYRGGASFTRHHDNQESAHAIIRLIVEKSNAADNFEILLQKELRSNGGRFADTSVGRELKRHLEEEIDLTVGQLLEHRGERPPYSYQKSQDPERQRIWKDWEYEMQNLTKDLEKQQTQLKRQFSGIRLPMGWIFGIDKILSGNHGQAFARGPPILRPPSELPPASTMPSLLFPPSKPTEPEKSSIALGQPFSTLRASALRSSMPMREGLHVTLSVDVALRRARPNALEAEKTGLSRWLPWFTG